MRAAPRHFLRPLIPDALARRPYLPDLCVLCTTLCGEIFSPPILSILFILSKTSLGFRLRAALFQGGHFRDGIHVRRSPRKRKVRMIQQEADDGHVESG